MKRNILFVSLAAITFFSCSKKVAVPDVVKTKFSTLYPDAKNVKWDKEDKQFEAGFKVNNTETSVVFDATGTLTETETAIPASALPPGILEYATQNLAGKKIEEAAKIVNASGKISYEAEVSGTDYIFDEAGNFLSKKDKEDKD